MKIVEGRKSKSQEQVYEAAKQLNTPCNGRMVATFLGWDSASVTNRLSELVKKDRLKVAYRKRGLDGMWRKYYVVNKKSEKEYGDTY